MPHSNSRRQILQGLAGLGAGLCLPASQAWAQSFPSKPVKLVVGAAPGGPVDFMARLYGDQATAMTGQSFVVDNKPGASGTIAAGMVAKSPQDGHTLFASGPAAIVVAPHLFAKLEYDPQKDFVPVCMLGAGAFVLAVHPSVPVNNVADLIAYAKKNPGSLSYGSGGNGSSGQLCSESFAARAGLNLLHVPYKGDGPAVNDLLGGQLKMMFTAPNVALPHMNSGKLKILAVTSQDRMGSLPQVPSVHETLSGFEYLGWVLLFAPAALPPEALNTLAAAWNRGLQDTNVKTRLEGLGMYPPSRYGSRESVNTLLKFERERTAQLVKKLGITPA
jgi:tripartite-type tricarboxylate transporter receptor subunit TctC